MRSEIFGYQVQVAPEGTKVFGDYGNPVAYLLIGKKVTYKLVRYDHYMPNPSHMMYVVNSNGNTCGLKGNYTFSDRDGDLEVMCNGFHPNDVKAFGAR